MRTLSHGVLEGLLFICRYRHLTIGQFARVAKFSDYHSAEVLRTLEGRGHLGHFGGSVIPGQGKTPKVYYLKRRGYEFLQSAIDDPEIAGPYIDVGKDATWIPQMYHRLRLIDLFVALEVQVRNLPHVGIVEALLEYRRRKGSLVRETTDFVDDPGFPENKLVPDGVFILENRETGRRGLFFVEMDMGTERIITANRYEYKQTVHFKLSQYDRYLTSGRFAQTYAASGEFRSFLLLFVTYGAERVANIREASKTLNARLHGYYRFTTFEQATADFLGSVWFSRSASDTVAHPLVQQTPS